MQLDGTNAVVVFSENMFLPGINELEAYLKSCSEDTRKLFENECSVMLECRVCRNVFRGFANFCSHKRRYCRSEMHDETPVDASNSSYKKVGGLRRTNMVKRLMQKSEVPESSSEVQLPPKEPTPDQNSDKVLLLQPQDNPVRHPGMCLRMRLKQDVTRMVTMEEVDCVERMLQHVPNMFEAGTVRCLNPSCSDVVPFGNIKALAYHMTVKHVKRERNGKPIPCLLCSKKFMTWTFLFSHIGRRHGQVKQDHLAYRKKEADEQTGKKRPRKQKSMDVGDGELLPKEENDDDGPPILKRAMENTDDDDDDVGCSASSRQGSSHEEDRQESKRLKIKRSRTAPAVTSIEGSAEQGKDDKISPIGARSSSPGPAAQIRTKSSRLRRKPDWMANEEFLIVDDRKIVSNNGKRGKPFDLAMVPVYLSFTQKQLFFSSLKQLDSKEPDGKHVCSQCNEVVPNLKVGLTYATEGRRHMVTHIRVMRLRCSLCGAGSFFCTDLRVHLMEGLCEKLHRAPAGIVKPNSIPCMTKEQADSLSELADVANPGRVMYTSGKVGRFSCAFNFTMR
ncbi:unnamed protein product [Heligmosomoides polygyrus]|uniref:C2H2-type domain-containing protein n=1 Tax=Heligmosomoides polygyrus TaxID=6339 RepID=A0A183GF75_HELPZ|nr:unnamed protein product [Heligmosomoides polygyrus]